jgi:PilZ domain-containing protein
MPRPAAKPFAIANPSAPVFRPPDAPKVSPSRERRHRPRVLLELPVRVRWLGPFGLETEITQTRNASRGGLLVSSAISRQVGSLFWATFPYDAAVAFTESETPGKVVRCTADPALGNTIAVAFHQLDLISPGDALSPNNSSSRAGRNDRRRHSRIALAFLVRIERGVRNSHSPRQELESPIWPEETMTVDVSPAGITFCTLRIYEVGERLVIAAQTGRRFSDGERRARVVRVKRAQTDSPVSHVAVEFLS